VEGKGGNWISVGGSLRQSDLSIKKQHSMLIPWTFNVFPLKKLDSSMGSTCPCEEGIADPLHITSFSKKR
jgi:hypothetical protein